MFAKTLLGRVGTERAQRTEGMRTPSGTIPLLLIAVLSMTAFMFGSTPVQAAKCLTCTNEGTGHEDTGGGGGSGGSGGPAPNDSTHVDATSQGTVLTVGLIGEFWEGCGFAPGDLRLAMDPAEISRLRNLERPAQIAVVPSRQDGVLMEVSDGASRGVGFGQTLVEFVNEVDWAKEIWAWNSCQGRLATLHQPGLQPGQTPTVNSVRLTRPALFGDPGPTTLVFRKPGFVGIWIDIAHFDPETFWGLADSKVVRFTWKTQ